MYSPYFFSRVLTIDIPLTTHKREIRCVFFLWFKPIYVLCHGLPLYVSCCISYCAILTLIHQFFILANTLTMSFRLGHIICYYEWSLLITARWDRHIWTIEIVDATAVKIESTKVLGVIKELFEAGKLSPLPSLYYEIRYMYIHIKKSKACETRCLHTDMINKHKINSNWRHIVFVVQYNIIGHDQYTCAE